MQRHIECDVAVVGGGAAGIAAAIGASRAGARTVLIERNPYFGGQATNSQVTAYCGFFTRGENYDQVVQGIGGEVLKKLEAYGTNIHPRPSKSTGNVSVSFNPEYVKLVMDQMLKKSSVEYFLHAQMYEVVNNNGMIEEIKCTDDEGTFTVKAKAFVDASGNANLVHFAGIATNWGDAEGKVQQSSLPFRIDNIPAREILKPDIEAALKKAKENGIEIKKETGLIIKIPDKTYGYCTIPSTIVPALDAETLTETEMELRSQVHNYAMAFKNIYTFGPTFRAENSNTTRHAAEFWMIEPEIAFADLKDDMVLAESMIKYIISYVLENAPEEMNFFNQFVDKGLIERLEHVLHSEFGHVTYTEAIKILEKHNDEFDYKVSWGCDLQTEHERYLTEKEFGRPVFVTDYPKEIKAFYMKLNEDGKTVAAMDCLVPGIGEIIGGSQREDNYEVLLQRMQECGLKPEDYQFYLDLRKYGGTRHAGFGLGFERAVMYLTGVGNIRDVLPYPRTVNNAEF